MFWNDIEELKREMVVLKNSLLRIEQFLCDSRFKDKTDPLDTKEIVRECLNEVFESEEEHASVNRIHDKLNRLLDDDKRKEEVELATATLDKFDDYMKNVHKLNEMINEFKGCVSMSRGAIGEGRALAGAVQQVQHIANISESIYKAMTSFVQAGDNLEHKAHFKIDFIYKEMTKFAEFMQNCEKKSPKKRKSVKKTAVSQVPLSQ